MDDELGVDWSKADKTIDKQAMVAAKRKEVLINSKDGQPTAFVDSKGGVMRVKPQMKLQKDMPPSLPATPRILASVAIVLMQAQQKGLFPFKDVASFTQVKLGQKADVVLVKHALEEYQSAEALQARLDGSRCVDLTQRQLHFRGMGVTRSVLFLTEAFKNKYPMHCHVLKSCSMRSPVHSVKLKTPKLELRDSLPERVKHPASSFLLVPSLGEPVKTLDMAGKETTVNQLDLSALFRRYASCYED